MSADSETEVESSQSESFRLFVAVAVPLQIRETIERGQAALRRELPGDLARWTKPEQFHLTLRFLGNVHAARVPELESKLREVCRPFSPMTLEAAGVGFFPEKRLPRVLWVGLQEQTQQISNLFHAIQEATRPFSSEPVEHDFHAHITLARIKRIKRREAEQLKQAAADLSGRVFGEWSAREVRLMRSQLSVAGAQHMEVGRFMLGVEREERGAWGA
jgi:2'-5' RNA ligase